MRYVFLSLEAVSFFQIYGPPGEEWYENFSPDLIPLPTYRTDNGDILVITHREIFDKDQVSVTLLICNPDEFLTDIRRTRRPEAFNRILRIAQSVVDQAITIPNLWKPWNADSLVSVQASPRSSGDTARLLYDRRIYGEIAGACYGTIPVYVDLVKTKPDLVDMDDANRRLGNLKILVEKDRIEQTETDQFDLEVSTKLLGLGDSLTTWYDSKLTATQRQFVNHPLTKSIRVRGPGGSGKTIAMVVKLLRQFESDKASHRPRRYALLTHSEATIELIWAMIRTMIPGSELTQLTNSGNLTLSTLYSIAYDTLGTELRGVQPLSLDGRLGRELQKELLESIFLEYHKNEWQGIKESCTDSFVERVDSAAAESSVRELLILEILNEFACALEPEGVSRSAKKKEEYINKAPKESWRLKLSQPNERRVILELHAAFRLQLRDMGAISVDQLISDFDRFLDSNAWEITRSTTGFDAIFIDELHLLNRMERMIVTSLVKDPESKPIIVMAEDVKQDTRRSSSGLTGWQRQFDDLTNYSLSEVFRYTPQINSFLRALDEFAPTLNLEEDWPTYGQLSRLPNGPSPNYEGFRDIKQQYTAIFPRAERAAKKRKNGRSVAILTCDYSNFKQYLQAGEHRDLFIPVESREDITSIPSRGTRFILSMPEFVAGLQFEEVYLIAVSENSLNSGETVGVSDKRRGLTTIYLGASRAMTKLTLSGLSDAGGCPAFVTQALSQVKAG